MFCLETDLLDRAIAAELRWCESHGFIPQQPSRDESEFDGKLITLRNVNGDLARYRVLGRVGAERLRRIEA